MAITQEAEEKTLTLEIDGQAAKAAAGETVLQVARRLSIEIPTLCHDDRLEPYGACRMCLVEIQGARGPVPACAAKISDGMEVWTTTDKVRKLRKFVIELLLSCLLYTSDAAADLHCVDLGGRRIIKKKKKKNVYRIL